MKITDLQAAPTRDLLREAYTLTHRIHAARDTNLQLMLRLRDERDLIDNEIVRRIEGQS